MPIIRVWSAGHLLEEVKTEIEQVTEIIDRLQRELDAGLMSFLTPVSKDLPVTILCVDVIEDGRLIKEYNLTRKK